MSRIRPVHCVPDGNAGRAEFRRRLIGGRAGSRFIAPRDA
jgi:hypothetical protein